MSVCVCVCVCERVCLHAGMSDEDIRVSRARAGSECWGGLGGSTGRKEDAVCLKCTHTQKKHPHTHLHPLCRGLCVYCMCGTQYALKTELRGTTLSAWGILYLYITPSSFAHLSLPCFSAPSLPSLTLTLWKPRQNFCLHSLPQKRRPLYRSLSLLPVANKQERRQPHMLKSDQFLISQHFFMLCQRKMSANRSPGEDIEGRKRGR